MANVTEIHREFGHLGAATMSFDSQTQALRAKKNYKTTKMP
ncbi:hypothetical protein [Thalassococcus lentus]|uniref:Uncharacterized protein n=1 Tax=Thalassococcus lentus TaxID=1210524 RepID=A0ABT4XPA8_9RHOB|nr:hypothetical protein [Thalassococcus lentus]MDA7423786.1 hypothetical protein [Thalassococcus lentus]